MPHPKKPIVGIFKNSAMDWGVFPERDEDNADWKIASSAIEKIETLPKDKPWFIGCGFRLPHVPMYASKKWFDLFPDSELKMPPVKEDDRDDIPAFASYLHWKLPEPRLSTLRKHDQWRPLVRAYLACTAFMDSQVGRVLEALEKSSQTDNTIVIVWGDHGWHLGEKLMTGKNTLWERSTRVPFIWAGPGVTKGQRCGRAVELLDIFPTLIVALLLQSATMDSSPENNAKENIAKTKGLTPEVVDAAQKLVIEMSKAKDLLLPLDQYLKNTNTKAAPDLK